MNYITLEGLEKKVSKLILGTMNLTVENMDQFCQLADCFVNYGGNTIDTAHIYGRGKSERAVGKWIRKTNKRDQMTIITKGAHYDPADFSPRVRPEYITSDLYESLERLQVSYIDIYMLHRDDPDVHVGSIIETLNKHVEDGKIRVFGASNWSHQRIIEANQYAKDHQLKGFVCSSINMSLAKQNEPVWKGAITANTSCIEWHEKTLMPLLSWSSQAGGFFTGRFSPDLLDNEDMVRVYYNDANWKRYRRVRQLAAKKGIESVQIALAFVLNQNFPTCALVGSQNVNELLSSIKGAMIQLTPEEVNWLDLKG